MSLSLTGSIDGGGRAMVKLAARHPYTGVSLDLEACVDTGFTGSLILTAQQISLLGLAPSATRTGRLADGAMVVMRAHTCLVPWFGALRQVEALLGGGQSALLGTELLDGLRLTIDYVAKTVLIEQP